MSVLLQIEPTLEAIDAEIERRQKRPKSPATLAEITSRGRWRRARHLDLLDCKLVDLAAGRIKRLVVTMPPRHGKSMLCSRYYPAWYLGMNPDNRVILCSYEAGFAATWGGQARDVLQEHANKLFGVTVSDETSARDDWRIDGRDGGMVTAGVGGPITGKGANLLIIDDPVKNSKEASSPTFRESIWRWWQSTALTRLEPDASVLVIQTRWHEDDLAGRLIKQDDDSDDDADESWEILNLPAIAEENDAVGRDPGEALWPERWPLAKLLKRMKRLGSYVWSALFQQRPTEPGGGYFKRQWFNIVESDRVPQLIEKVRAWDLAATAQGENGNSDPDWLAGCKMARGIDKKYYLVHMHADRTTPEGVESALKQFATLDGRGVPIRIEQEGAASGKIVKHHFQRMMDGWDCRFTSVPRTNKLTRSHPFNAACERGDVVLVAGPWVEDFLAEAEKFPNGSHDDRVDAAVAAYTALVDDVSPWSEMDVADVLDGSGPADPDEDDIESRVMAMAKGGHPFTR